MKYLLIILSLLFWSCEDQNDVNEETIDIPDFSETCEYIYNDVDGSLESCSSNCELVYVEVDLGDYQYQCYHTYDLEVLAELKNNNESLSEYNLLEIGEQSWQHGRLRSLNIEDMSLTYLPEDFCNLNCSVYATYNNLCDEYQYDCCMYDYMNDITQCVSAQEQDISYCEGYSEYYDDWYYDNHIDILDDIRDSNPSLTNQILLDIGTQTWEYGKLRGLDLSNLGLVSLPENICNIEAYYPGSDFYNINVSNNQLCEEYQYDCIPDGVCASCEWGNFESDECWEYYINNAWDLWFDECCFDWNLWFGYSQENCEYEWNYRWNNYWEPQDCQE